MTTHRGEDRASLAEEATRAWAIVDRLTEESAQQAAEMAELRRAIAMTTQAFEAEVERLRAALEKARQTAMTMLRAERVCERSHRDGERNAHVHEDVVHDWAVALVPFARAALAATPVAPAPAATVTGDRGHRSVDGYCVEPGCPFHIVAPAPAATDPRP